MKNAILKFTIKSLFFIISIIILIIMLIGAKFVSELILQIIFFVLDKFVVISRNAILEIMISIVLVKIITYIVTIVIFSKAILCFINSKKMKEIFK